MLFLIPLFEMHFAHQFHGSKARYAPGVSPFTTRSKLTNKFRQVYNCDVPSETVCIALKTHSPNQAIVKR
jgi:hypothetical protein